MIYYIDAPTKAERYQQLASVVDHIPGLDVELIEAYPLGDRLAIELSQALPDDQVTHLRLSVG